MNPEKAFNYRETVAMLAGSLKAGFPQAEEIYRYHFLAENPKIPDLGIHGQLHVARLLVLTRLVAGFAGNGQGFNQAAVDLAAVEHDRQRLNDGHDLWHGVRAAKNMTERLKGTVDPVTLNLSAEICFWHVWPDWLAPVKLTHSFEWRVFKDADALDRTRNGEPHDLGDLNVRYLRLPQSVQLTDLARELAARSQIQMDVRGNAFAAVIDSGLELGIIGE